MIGFEEADKVLPGKRLELLNKAFESAKHWCVHPSQVAGKRPSDQKWLELFAKQHQEPNGISPDNAYLFIQTYMLSRAGPWKRPELASAVTDFINEPVFNRSQDIAGLEKALQTCTARDKPRQQTSAASKFAMFVKPEENIFIWDQLANRAVRWRNRVPGALYAYYRLKGQNAHNYESYAQACQKALDEERKNVDFREKVEKFATHIAGVGGPMADRSKIAMHFLERRLFDKLLFHEGEEIRALEAEQKERRRDEKSARVTASS